MDKCQNCNMFVQKRQLRALARLGTDTLWVCPRCYLEIEKKKAEIERIKRSRDEDDEEEDDEDWE